MRSCINKEAALITAQTLRRALGMAVALLLVLGVAAPGRAQGMFYAEETKDGRIYVFNIKDNWERFKASGETGTGLTRLGVGPNGETVYADNETALELFFFKHGITGERGAAEAAGPDGRVARRQDPLHPRRQLLHGDVEPHPAALHLRDARRLHHRSRAPAAGGDSKGSFRIRRAKFKLEGWFYKPTLEFELQLNWTDVVNTPASQILEDANIDWDISKKKAFRVKFGQFKAPFGRQQLTSSGAQQFVDRAIIDGRYNHARETGLALWGTLGTNKLDWRVMVSNGNGRTPGPQRQRQVPLHRSRDVAGHRQHAHEPVGLGRAHDRGRPRRLRRRQRPLSSPSPGSSPTTTATATTTANDLKNRTCGGDYTFKYKGFASVAERDWRTSTPETGAEFDDKGFLGQASYAWKAPGIPGASFWELAFRYAKIDPSDLVADNDRKEIGGAFNYYYNRHNLKVQADFRQLKDDAANSGRGTKNKEFRLQTAVHFLARNASDEARSRRCVVARRASVLAAPRRGADGQGRRVHPGLPEDVRASPATSTASAPTP